MADVIRTSVALGASYPDIVQMLVQAQRQQNVPGQIAIDAVPRTGRAHFRDSDSPAAADSGPNLFPTIHRDTKPETGSGDEQAQGDEPEDPGPTQTRQDDPGASDEGAGGASLADRRITSSAPVTSPTTRSATDPQASPQDSSGSRFSFLEKLFR